MTATFLRKGAPCAPLDLDAIDAVLLLEALSDHQEKLDKMGCLRDLRHTRELLGRVRMVAQMVAGKG